MTCPSVCELAHRCRFCSSSPLPIYWVLTPGPSSIAEPRQQWQSGVNRLYRERNSGVKIAGFEYLAASHGATLVTRSGRAQGALEG